MSRLTPEQQQLILDFYFRCGTEEDIHRGRDLIASNHEAARLYSGLEETLTELDSIKYESCPDNLAELTIARLRLAAAAQKTAREGGSRLRQLLDEESRKELSHSNEASQGLEEKKNLGFLRVFFEIGAMAAAVVLVSGLLFPTLSTMRAHSDRIACEANFGAIGRGLITYASDNNNQVASAGLEPGAPWWKIGYQSPQNQSNTRHVWQLVRQGYLDGNVFVCPGNKEAEAVAYDDAAMQNLQDFPSRRNISYSFMLMCTSGAGTLQKRRIIMSDMNPVFVRIPTEPSIYQKLNEFEKVCLDEQMSKLLSPNHHNRGQNVLFCDGSVEFLEERIYQGDDIFTIQNVHEYTGREVPKDEDDIFLVP